MTFPVNFMYFKNYTLASIPTKLMYKHRVDYYDYTTVLYSILTCNKLHIKTVSRIGNRTLEEGFMHWVNEHWEMHVGARGTSGEGFMHRDQCVPRTVSFSATIDLIPLLFQESKLLLYN